MPERYRGLGPILLMLGQVGLCGGSGGELDATVKHCATADGVSKPSTCRELARHIGRTFRSCRRGLSERWRPAMER